MNVAEIAAVLGVVVVAAYLFVRIPRSLFVEAAGEAPPRRLEWGLAAALAAIGILISQVGPGPSPMARLALALCIMILVAVIYSDLTYLLIPDLYSAGLAVLAVTAPWRLPVMDALAGAVLCGGLLAVVAFAWKRATAVEGLGFGDVKLAAAAGGLLGAQSGLLAISVSAGVAAALVFALKLIRRNADASPLIPYGAALALAAGGSLTAGLL